MNKKKGVIYAVAAYVMWGLAPMYFKLIDFIAAPEILVHRIIWSFALLIIITGVIKKWTAVQQVIKQPRTLLILLGSSVLLCCNWGLFIWAVNNDRILDASLGYYINPLLNVLLGVLFLGERLKRLQVAAFTLAAIGVLIQVIGFGSVPWVSLILATSFAFYGLIRKTIAVDSLTGLLIESTVMLPLAFIYWINFADSSAVNMMDNSWTLNLILIIAGVVTTAPLLCFIAGAKRIQYTTMGFLQYIGPSIMFVQAITLYDESVGADRWLTFAMIWLSLIAYSWHSYSSAKR
jgi:chloramphenicol-sensitive protein RarD